jgi:hypothetical protein
MRKTNFPHVYILSNAYMFLMERQLIVIKSLELKRWLYLKSYTYTEFYCISLQEYKFQTLSVHQKNQFHLY